MVDEIDVLQQGRDDVKKAIARLKKELSGSLSQQERAYKEKLLRDYEQALTDCEETLRSKGN
jgi:hypothetical protein